MSKPESSRSLSSRTESDLLPSRAITERASASPVEIRVPPRKVSDQGLSSRGSARGSGRAPPPRPPKPRGRPMPTGPWSKKRSIGRSSSLRVSGGSISYALSEKTTRPILPSVSASDCRTRITRCDFCASTLVERSSTTMPPLPLAK